MMLQQISQILSNSDNKNSNIPPTLLYNEGWMQRLVLNYFATNDIKDFPLSFHERKKWYSEALLPSHFLPENRADKLAESWTHADGVFGDFKIGDSSKGDLSLMIDAKVFVVTEAKMSSKLSSGVKNANYFNQAARNIACIAELLNRANLSPDSFDKLGFYVIAPQSQIEFEPTFKEYLTPVNIKKTVYRRVEEYSQPDKKKEWYNNWFLPLMDKIEISTLSWESIIQFIKNNDNLYGDKLTLFYNKCLDYCKK